MNLTTNNKLRLLAGNVRPTGAGALVLNQLAILLTSVTSFTINYKYLYTFVHSLLTGNNKFMASIGATHGCSVNLNNAVVTCVNKVGKTMGFIRGNGTNWTLNNDVAGMTVGTNSISDFIFTPSNVYSGTAAQNAILWRSSSAQYIGTTADRAVIKLTSGLGGSSFGFRLIVASTGLAVTTNSTTDAIEITVNQASAAVGIPATNTTVLLPKARLNVIGFLE